jgi:rubrerythrin
MIAMLVVLFPFMRDIEVVKPGTSHCTNCGYNLTGNTSGKCPECGSRVQSG